MLSPNEEMAIMAERREKLLRAAKMQQLYWQADEDRAQLSDRLMTLLGDLLINSGTKLKEHAHYEVEQQKV